MKETKMSGLIRRFDDLGRIVVPHEIRKLLHLHEGDAMEISVAGNSIHLNKYQPLHFQEALCGPYLAAFCKKFKIACAICDTEHVLCSRMAAMPGKPMLSQSAKEHIQAQETYLYSHDKPMFLLEDGSCKVDALCPIGTKEQPVGAVVLLHHRSATDAEWMCAQLLAGILTEVTIQEEKNI